MVGVQSEEKCTKCGYLYGFHEFQTRTGEEYFLCGRCGYHHSTRVVIDNQKSRRIKAQVEKLIKAGKIDEAFDLAGIKLRGYKDGKEYTEKDLSKEEKLEHLKNRSFQYIKMKNGKYVYTSSKSGGYGAYSYMGLKGVGTNGSLEKNGHAEFEKWAKKNLKHFEEVFYTKKLNGKWIRVDLKNNKEEEFKDDWHKYLNAKQIAELNQPS